METLRIISLGWGVQSFTIAAMSALGDLPPVHAALHSDTTHERSETYTFAARWTDWLIERGVRVVTVHPRKPWEDFTNVNGRGAPPFFTISQKGNGVLKRSCTHRWKLTAMRTWITAELKALGVKKSAGVVEQWLGISLDEVERMNPSDVQYITTRWPLIEKRMTRLGCEQWLTAHGLEVPPKSACYFCPFHSDGAWRSLSPVDFDKAIAVDNSIRGARNNKGVELFLHKQRIPLSAVDLRTPQERGQLELLPSDECSGVCFV